MPPLNALRAFEAAARHLSFLKAAEELHVTPGAVSQQVKSLEDMLGVKLFRRLPRGVLLSDAGQRYGQRLGELFDGIAGATNELRRDSAPGVLTVSTTTSFAARWLIPRLGGFNLAHPGIMVRISAENAMTDFATDDVDLGLRYGGGVYPGLRSELLFAEEIFPVCSPALLARTPLETLDDLQHVTLLHDEPYLGSHEVDWESWLAARGAGHIEIRPAPRFTHTHMSLQAAAAGMGVALGTNVLAAEDLASGVLARPFTDSVPSRHAYWLVYPQAWADRPKLKSFRDWVLEEGQRFLGGQTSDAWRQFTG
ncbi:MAG TPA: transcriptional regulator GcvA [Aliidongia sp.]|nr:transcriptional regulator GcvA [Aliidongia sp.]